MMLLARCVISLLTYKGKRAKDATCSFPEMHKCEVTEGCRTTANVRRLWGELEYRVVIGLASHNYLKVSGSVNPESN